MEQIAQKAVEDAVLKVATALEDQVDEQLHRMENMGEDELEQIRQSRMHELRKREEKRKEWLMRGHGEYGEVLSEKDFFATMKGEERMVCHFYRDNWPCKVMDKHMGLLAQKHIETKFVKIHAEKSPFLTEKLKIWMLPTLALIKSEKTVDYVVGFDELGGVDDFRTEVLAARLAGQGLIFHEAERYQQDASGSQQRAVQKGFAMTRTESDEDSDFD